MRLLPLVALLALACGMRHAPTPAAPFRVPHAADTITRVRVGMSQVEVQSLLGSPDALDYGLTWCGWLDGFCFSPNAWREIFHYKGEGRITLRYGLMLERWRGGEVVLVEPDPTERGE